MSLKTQINLHICAVWSQYSLGTTPPNGNGRVLWFRIGYLCVQQSVRPTTKVVHYGIVLSKIVQTNIKIRRLFLFCNFFLIMDCGSIYLLNVHPYFCLQMIISMDSHQTYYVHWNYGDLVWDYYWANFIKLWQLSASHMIVTWYYHFTFLVFTYIHGGWIAQSLEHRNGNLRVPGLSHVMAVHFSQPVSFFGQDHVW